MNPPEQAVGNAAGFLDSLGMTKEYAAPTLIDTAALSPVWFARSGNKPF
jgi:hypothetical protein